MTLNSPSSHKLDKISEQMIALIDQLSADDSLAVIKYIQQTYKQKHRTENRLAAQQFKIGDIVNFELRGQVCLAMVLKINLQKIGVITYHGQRWQIAPHQLSLVTQPSDEARHLFVNYLGPLKSSENLQGPPIHPKPPVR